MDGNPQIVLTGSSLDYSAIAVGIIAPLLTAFFTAKSTPSAVQGGICFLVALLMATLENIANFKADQWVTTLTTVMVTSQTLYGMIYKPTGLTAALQSVGPVKDKEPPAPAAAPGDNSGGGGGNTTTNN